MSEKLMETTWRNALWQQFGAAIAMLENALLACPASLWEERIWHTSPDQSQPSEDATFWSITYHVLFWLDLYLVGTNEGFAPSMPFTRHEAEAESDSPTRLYTQEELHGYLVHLREKCQTTLTGLSDERAQQQVTFPWSGGTFLSFLELQLYNMRHVQEHAAQLSLFLGQHAIPDEVLDWVAQAQEESGS